MLRPAAGSAYNIPMLLSDRDRAQVRQMLAAMAGPVRLVFFTQSLSCESCAPTRQILDELTVLGDKLSIDERNLILDKDGAAAYGVDRVPAIVLVAGENRDTGIRFYGAPSGYEFSALIDAVVAASNGRPPLAEETRAQLAALTAPVHIQVFVTPT